MEIQEAQNGEEAASELPPPPFDGAMPQLELYERQDDSVEADEERINDGKLLQYYSSASKEEDIRMSDDEEEEEDYVAPSNRGSKNIENAYIKSIIADSKPKILKPNLINRAFKENGEVGLFHLFLTNDLLKAIVQWTNHNIDLKASSTKKITVKEMKKYIGLELAMSIIKLNQIQDYWSTDSFLGHPDFGRTMGRQRFCNIRRFLIFRNPNLARDNNETVDDPLWHSRSILNHFMRMCASYCVPGRVASLDENGVRCTGRCRAVSYIPIKPDKFAIRFYAIVCWDSLYIFSLFDNSAGLRSPLSPVARYSALHPIIRTPVVNVLKQEDCSIKENSASALWMAQCAHMEKLSQTTSEGNRLVFMDNFYTRHALANALSMVTDGKVRIVGTIKLSNVDAMNTSNIQDACAQLKDAPRGSWRLVAAYNPPADIEEQRKTYNKEKRKRSKEEQKQMPPFMPSYFSAAPNAGFIVFLDKKIVVVYTNNLAGTPSERILPGTNEEAQLLVHGLVNMKRWTGGESMHRTTLKVPAVFAAYNLFMNGVDRVDQIRSSMVSMKKENRVSMSLWTAILDWSCINSFSLYRSMNLGNLKFREYKRKIVKQLCFGSDDDRRHRRPKDRDYRDDGNDSTVSASTNTVNVSVMEEDKITTTTMTTTTTTTTMTTVAGTREKDWVKAFRETIGLNQGNHVLLPLKQRSRRKSKEDEAAEDVEEETEEEVEQRRKSSIDCRLCSMCKDPGDKKHYKSTYGCAPCKSAYHPECFSLVHHEQALNVNHEIFRRFSRTLARSKIDGSEEIRRRFKPVTRVQTFKDLNGMKIPASAGWKKTGTEDIEALP